eukprot:gene3941-4307_t
MVPRTLYALTTTILFLEAGAVQRDVQQYAPGRATTAREENESMLMIKGEWQMGDEDEDHCDWQWVNCDDQLVNRLCSPPLSAAPRSTERVTMQGIQGNIPSMVNELPFLTYVSLFDNALSGTIPAVDNLARLQVLLYPSNLLYPSCILPTLRCPSTTDASARFPTMRPHGAEPQRAFRDHAQPGRQQEPRNPVWHPPSPCQLATLLAATL